MKKKSTNFYLWALGEVIKATFEWQETDTISIYSLLKKDFPNAIKALERMYSKFKEPAFCKAKPLSFEKVEYVYEAISSLISNNKTLRYDIKTKEQHKKYKKFNICSWGWYVPIERIDLIIIILLFTEEFILQPITQKNVVFTRNNLTVYGEYITFKVSRHKDKTYICIKIRNAISIQYTLLN